MDVEMASKKATILVNVEEELADLMVVSYSCSRGVFQGVLMNSTKKILPCGVTLPQSIMSPKTGLDEDSLFSVSQRFTYFQDKMFKAGQTAAKPKKSKLTSRSNMTVRLRPRQVLCSKCKGICNENSENVDHSQRKETVMGERRLSHPGEKSPRPLFSENQQDNQPKLSMQPPLPVCSIVPPSVTRLRFGNVQPKKWLQPNANKSPSPPVLASLSPKTEPSPCLFEMEANEGEAAGDSEASVPTEEAEPPELDDKRVLRKRRSVGAMEDLWNEKVFVEEQKKAVRTTPVIKICFGSQGEGTVLKIPSKVQNYNPSESEAEEKAVRKAMKKAKKEAKRKLCMTSPLPEEVYRKHRRKEKHKKKHKSDVATLPKISINLKRLNDREYNMCREEEDDSCSSSSMSDEECPPKFPPTPSKCLPMAGQEVSTNDGSNLSVGDVVWGKVHGFPWWPGKVLSISKNKADGTEDTSEGGEETAREAHVSWFGSSTSSTMSANLLCPFLEFFKLRFNKKKKSSCYKEAIRQATAEAKRNKTNNETVLT